MIIDTSVIMALILGEPEAAMFGEMMRQAPRRMMSAGSRTELTAVIVRKRPEINEADLDTMLDSAAIVVAPVTEEQCAIACAAYREYGRGTEHKARLNFGDCFAYALAKATGEPLLFKGDDFVHTDIPAA